MRLEFFTVTCFGLTLGCVRAIVLTSSLRTTVQGFATIASYLEPPGKERWACYRRVKKLYDARSKAAHGSQVEEADPLFETYALLKRALTRMIEDNYVPTREDLEAMLFGNELGTDVEQGAA